MNLQSYNSRKIEPSPYDSSLGLLNALRAKEEKAWGYLLNNVYFSSLAIIQKFPVLRLNIDADEEAKDLTQSVLRDFYMRLEKDLDLPSEKHFRLFELATIEGYLFICCKHQWSNTCRNRKWEIRFSSQQNREAFEKHVVNNLEDTNKDPYAIMEYKDMVDWVEKGIKVLTPKQQRLLKLYMNGHSISSIKDQEGFNSIEVTNVALSRAKSRLIEVMKHSNQTVEISKNNKPAKGMFWIAKSLVTFLK